MNTCIRLQNHCRQVVDRSSDNLAGEAPVDRHADGVYRLPIDDNRLHSRGDKRLRFNLAARGADHDPVAVCNASVGRQLRTDLREHLRLKLRQPAIEAAHGPAQVMFSQSVAGRNQRETGVSGRCQRIGGIERNDRQRVALLSDQRVPVG